MQLWLRDGKLTEGAVMHRPRDLLFHDAYRCVDVLATFGTRPGCRSVYLALQGYLLPEVRAILNPGPLTRGHVLSMVRFLVTGYTTQ